MEKYAADNPGTPLFARPIYRGPTWIPEAIDSPLLVDDKLWSERFDNR